MFLSNMSESRRLTTTFFPTMNDLLIWLEMVFAKKSLGKKENVNETRVIDAFVSIDSIYLYTHQTKSLNLFCVTQIRGQLLIFTDSSTISHHYHVLSLSPSPSLLVVNVAVVVSVACHLNDRKAVTNKTPLVKTPYQT